nr:MAG TPA: hypothetical protein [Caudoviricetes sp.]
MAGKNQKTYILNFYIIVNLNILGNNYFSVL